MGRFKLIESPQTMWELFEKYRKQVKDNPRIRVEYVGKDGNKVETPVERPLTIEGFKCYVANEKADIQAYWNNRGDSYSKFSPILTRIREEIRLEQIDGGMSGFYNASLTARINSLTDKTQIDHKASVNILTIDPLADNEADNRTQKDSES